MEFLQTEQEIAQLREEVRKLREQQERQQHTTGNGHKPDQETDQEQDQNKEGQKKDEQKPPGQHRRRLLIILAVLVVVAGAGVVWWLHERHFEDTDDALVDGHISGIASRIAGTITGVYAEEDQFVKAGQVLVDLDPRDYKTAIQQAEGQVEQARGQALAEQPNIPVTEVTNTTNIATSDSAVAAATDAVAAAESNYQAALEKVSEAEANNAKAQQDAARYRPLVEKDEISQQQFDQVIATATAMAATVAAAHSTADAAQKQVAEARQQLLQARQRAHEVNLNAPRQMAIRQAMLGSRRGSAEVAMAELEQARLNLSYCKIVAPFTGIVAKRIAEVGMSVAPGQQVFLVTNLDDLWVTADFRETQLRNMHPGQSVRIHVDSLGTDFDGYIESMPAASGAVTSLLPPENATGNFVKIVQRLPVRIRFKKNQPGLERLRPGMSVEPRVRVS